MPKPEEIKNQIASDVDALLNNPAALKGALNSFADLTNKANIHGQSTVEDSDSAVDARVIPGGKQLVVSNLNSDSEMLEKILPAIIEHLEADPQNSVVSLGNMLARSELSDVKDDCLKLFVYMMVLSHKYPNQIHMLQGQAEKAFDKYEKRICNIICGYPKLKQQANKIFYTFQANIGLLPVIAVSPGAIYVYGQVPQLSDTDLQFIKGQSSSSSPDSLKNVAETLLKAVNAQVAESNNDVRTYSRHHSCQQKTSKIIQSGMRIFLGGLPFNGNYLVIKPEKAENNSNEFRKIEGLNTVSTALVKWPPNRPLVNIRIEPQYAINDPNAGVSYVDAKPPAPEKQEEAEEEIKPEGLGSRPDLETVFTGGLNGHSHVASDEIIPVQRAHSTTSSHITDKQQKLNALREAILNKSDWQVSAFGGKKVDRSAGSSVSAPKSSKMPSGFALIIKLINFGSRDTCDKLANASSGGVVDILKENQRPTSSFFGLSKRHANTARCYKAAHEFMKGQANSVVLPKCDLYIDELYQRATTEKRYYQTRLIWKRGNIKKAALLQLYNNIKIYDPDTQARRILDSVDNWLKDHADCINGHRFRGVEWGKTSTQQFIEDFRAYLTEKVSAAASVFSGGSVATATFAPVDDSPL